MKLTELKCIPCRGGEPQATQEEIDTYKQQLPEWRIVEKEGVKRLERTFRFDNFAQAMDFANRVGEIAEDEGHHPLLEITWGKAKVSWWTHVIRGLHRNDFIMAAKTDEAYSA